MASLGPTSPFTCTNRTGSPPVLPASRWVHLQPILHIIVALFFFFKKQLLMAPVGSQERKTLSSCIKLRRAFRIQPVHLSWLLYHTLYSSHTELLGFTQYKMLFLTPKAFSCAVFAAGGNGYLYASVKASEVLLQQKASPKYRSAYSKGWGTSARCLQSTAQAHREASSQLMLP